MQRSPLIAIAALTIVLAAAAAACGGSTKEKAATTPEAEATTSTATAPSPGAFAPAPGPSGPPQEFIDKAIAIIAEREKIDPSGLSLAASTTDDYPLSGESAYSFKVVDSATGEIYGISLDPGGEEVDAEDLLKGEEKAYTDKYGGLEAELFDRLQSAPPDVPIDVTIWLKEPPYNPPPLPDFSEQPLTNKDAENCLRLADEKRAEAVSTITKPALDAISGMGLRAEADKYTPSLNASLTPEEIRKAEDLKGLERIYEVVQFEPAVDVARQVVHADVLNTRGLTGVNEKVAEIEVGGQVDTDNPNLSGVTQDTTNVCLSDHAAAVAGIIRSTNSTVRGVAPDAELWIGGSCGGGTNQLKAAANTAADWGASVFNNSWAYTSCSFSTDANKFFDDMVSTRSRTVVFAAGNRGNSDACVTSPAQAYNVIAVGASDDHNTTDWSDDTVADYSSYQDPSTTFRDREEPDVMAPGTNFQSTTNADPWTGGVGSGTSYAAPVVTGVIADLFQRMPTLRILPTTVRAILMATAAHNIEGDARLSEKDGAGEIVAEWADDVVQNVNGTFHAGTYNSNWQTPFDFPISNYSLVAGRPTRIVLIWDVDTSYTYYKYRPSGDLDMEIIDPSGNVVASSASYDNNYEIVYFAPAVSGTYKVRVIRSRWSTDVTRQFTYAVFQGDPSLLPTPVPPTATATPRPTPTKTATPGPAATATKTSTPKPPTKTPTPGPSPTPKPPTRTPHPTRGLPTPYM
jgi:hypothetical protein